MRWNVRIAGSALLCLLATAPVFGDETGRPGHFEYRGRWLPKRLKSRVVKWEKLDARTNGWRDAYKDKSRHYRIETSVPRFVLELEIKPFLDELYRTYTEVFRRDFGLKGKGANKKTIRVFYRYPEYAVYAKDGNPPVPRANPGFILGGDELVVFYEETSPALFYGTVFHEGAHQFVHNLLPGADLPLWLDEGLATYFEGCTYSRTTRKITVGHLPPDRLHFAQKALREARPAAGASLPERLFMNVAPERFTAREYALAWSFIYYLTHCEEGRYKRRFAKLLKLANGAGRTPIAHVFKRAGIPLKQLEAGWRDYVLGLEAPPAPAWILLEVESDVHGLRTDDRVWSVDGVLVKDRATFERLWQEYPDDRAVEWVVVRRRGDAESFVCLTVPAGDKPALGAMRTLTRSHSLAD